MAVVGNIRNMKRIYDFMPAFNHSLLHAYIDMRVGSKDRELKARSGWKWS